MRVANRERDRLIRNFIEKGRTFREVAKFFNMAVSSVHQAWKRASNKA